MDGWMILSVPLFQRFPAYHFSCHGPIIELRMYQRWRSTMIVITKVTSVSSTHSLFVSTFLATSFVSQRQSKTSSDKLTFKASPQTKLSDIDKRYRLHVSKRFGFLRSIVWKNSSLAYDLIKYSSHVMNWFIAEMKSVTVEAETSNFGQEVFLRTWAETRNDCKFQRLWLIFLNVASSTRKINLLITFFFFKLSLQTRYNCCYS